MTFEKQFELGIAGAAHEEVHSRHPVWRDNGGPKGNSRYRSGFVDGADWAGSRLRGEVKRATRKWETAQKDLDRARQLVEAANAKLQEAANAKLQAASNAQLQAAAWRTPVTAETRRKLTSQAADLVSDAPIHFSEDGLAIVGDPEIVARKVIDLIFKSIDVMPR